MRIVVEMIDLTDLARGYRFRTPTAVTLTRAREAAVGRSGLLLDIGGGTGAHASQWRGEGVWPVVVDASESMCREASKGEGLGVVRAVSQQLPLRDASADLVYFHLSIHYGSWSAAVEEAWRVAKPGAVIEIWTFAPETMAASALARWFPRIGDLDAKRFPPIEAITTRLGRLGADVEVAHCPETVERSARAWEQAVRNRFVSTIQLLSAAEIDEGLERFGAVFSGDDAIYRYTIEFVRIRATRQPLA